MEHATARVHEGKGSKWKSASVVLGSVGHGVLG